MSVQYAGISAAVQAKDVHACTTKREAGALFRDLVEQMQPALRRHVGDVKPRGDVAVNLSGPHADPVQGMIYVMSLSVPVETDDLPVDCTAYEALALGPERYTP